jgi:hypothetical protein
MLLYWYHPFAPPLPQQDPVDWKGAQSVVLSEFGEPTTSCLWLASVPPFPLLGGHSIILVAANVRVNFTRPHTYIEIAVTHKTRKYFGPGCGRVLVYLRLFHLNMGKIANRSLAFPKNTRASLLSTRCDRDCFVRIPP